MMKNYGVFVVGFALLSLELRAALVAGDFSTIAQRNVFRLIPTKPEQKPEVVQPELPQISLQGVTTLLDSRQALLKIQTKTKPAATEVSCILGEGQARDGVKVLRIDMKSGTVWLTNQGAEQVLTIKR